MCSIYRKLASHERLASFETNSSYFEANRDEIQRDDWVRDAKKQIASLNPTRRRRKEDASNFLTFYPSVLDGNRSR